MFGTPQEALRQGMRLRPARVRLVSYELGCPTCGERLALPEGTARAGQMTWRDTEPPPAEITCACGQRCEVLLKVIDKMYDQGISPRRRCP